MDAHAHRISTLKIAVTGMMKTMQNRYQESKQTKYFVIVSRLKGIQSALESITCLLDSSEGTITGKQVEENETE